jgi:hypothetical protein
LEEFANDPSAYRRLATTSGRSFNATLARLRHEREIEESKATARCELDAAGIPITKRPRHSDQAIGIEYLYDEGGNELTCDSHRSCPGNAAYVDHNGDVRYVCLVRQPHGVILAGVS